MAADHAVRQSPAHAAMAITPVWERGGSTDTAPGHTAPLLHQHTLRLELHTRLSKMQALVASFSQSCLVHRKTVTTSSQAAAHLHGRQRAGYGPALPQGHPCLPGTVSATVSPQPRTPPAGTDTTMRPSQHRSIFDPAPKDFKPPAGTSTSRREHTPPRGVAFPGCVQRRSNGREPRG
jgi:hypothetical protein